MNYFKIPSTFFEAIGQKDARYQVLWMRWIVYGEELKNPEILEKLKRENQNQKISGELVREIYEFGLPYMRDSLFFSTQNTSKVQQSSNENSERIEKLEKAITTLHQMIKERSSETVDTYRRVLTIEDSVKKLNDRDSVIEKMAEKIGLIEDDISDLRKENEEKNEEAEVNPDNFDKFQPKDDIVLQVIEYLNQMSGGTYSHKSKKNKELIRLRQKEGYGLEDFKTVIRKKCEEWKGTEQEKYLRPITLFNAGKFENYLNQPEKKNNNIPVNQHSKIANAVSKASEYFTMGSDGQREDVD